MPHLEEVVNSKKGTVIVRDGKFAHFCHEWDDALIDENDPEFESCTCEWGPLSEEAHRIKDALWDKRLKEMEEAEATD